ncbi:MAG TPA: YfdX family protein, partial [Dokdonella sp.]|uniref:YfdX family protein n=1 Tax=Dokdonella sp. TaxID=2291710 RepID=UPI002D7F4EA7
MKSRTIKMQALALAIAIPMAAASAWSMSPAQTSAAAGGKADHSSVENTPLLQFSREGNRALREIQAARFNIFDGQPDVAVKLMNDAKVAIGNAEKDAPSFATTRSTIVDGKVVDSESSKRAATSVPVDGQLM